MFDFGPFFGYALIIILAFWILWQKKRRWLIGFLILSTITSWVDPYFPQPTLQGQFVYEITSYGVAFVGSYVLLGRRGGSDN